MSSIGAGKLTPMMLAFEQKNGKYYCSYMGVNGMFHTKPTARELAKIAKIMEKYKCNQLSWNKEN